jgi:hypothetical protein
MRIPNLNEVVLKALDFLASKESTARALDLPEHTLVIGSGNALPTGRVLFHDRNFVFRDAGSYRQYLDLVGRPEAVVVISASGEKHAPRILDDLSASGISSFLLTCNRNSSAGQRLPASHVFETASLAEPLTYNTSSYLGMMLAKTAEDPAEISKYIRSSVVPLVVEVGAYEAYYLLLPERFEPLAEMFLTKFDELFGGRVNGRCYTVAQSMHAKTVVPWEKELFVSFGEPNDRFGTARLHLPLYPGAGFAAVLAVGYYLVGQIQAEKTPWFAENVESYAGTQRRLFSEPGDSGCDFTAGTLRR